MQESKKTSRLPKPSVAKPAQTKVKPLSEKKLNRLQHTVLASSKLTCVRRSKSVADLHTLLNKKSSKVINIKDDKQGTTKTAQKRKIEKGSDEDLKPKMIKQAKIPDWDYKSRFLQLREKHMVLNEDYKKQSSNLIDIEDIKSKYNEILKQHEILEKDYATICNLNTDINKENEQFQTKLTELETNLQILMENHTELKQSYDALVVKDKRNTEDIERISKENSELKTNLQKTEKKFCNLQNEHENFTAKYNLLEKKYKEIVDENKYIRENLDKELQKSKDLSSLISNLKTDVYNGELLRRKLHNAVQDLKGNIRVFCRVRPPINLEEEERLQCMITFPNEKTLEIRKSRESISTISGNSNDLKTEFTLDRVFEPRSSQKEVFEDLSQLVQSALDGYDICVFAYGQTGSGKTYTMQGGETSDEGGLVPRTIDLIFNSIDILRRTGWLYEIKASFLEIYNENIRDLLDPNFAQNLEIRYNEGKGTTVTNLTIQSIKSACELEKLMKIAYRNRAVAATDFNEHSSRSHAVTKIYLHGVNKDTNTVYTGSVNLVDLAGSESAKTSASERLVETKNINKSLSTLGSVMLALYNKEKHIPYRNSKLTYLLQSSLGGNSKTLMVVNISPFEDCYAESINSLRFAAKVKEVKTSAKRNKTNFALAISKA